MTDYERELLDALSRWAHKLPEELNAGFKEIAKSLERTSEVLTAFAAVLEEQLPGFCEALNTKLDEAEEVSNAEPAPEAGADL